MRVLVTGAGGQLGRDVVAAYEEAGHDVLACGRKELDITNLDQCQRVMTAFQPDCIVHCAAYTAVDAAESDIYGAYLVNAVGTRNLAVSSEQAGAKLIYISTDYVFDGKGNVPYYEYDAVSPESVYGQTKHAGERLTQSLCSRWFIVRTSWVFGLHGANFVKTMLKLTRDKPVLQVVDDQKGSPTYTVDLAAFLLELSQTEKYGIYHATNSGACTWYEFTQAILEDAAEQLHWPVTARLEPCTTAQFPRPAPRPAHSVLEHMSIRTNGFKDLPPWREGLRRFLLAMQHDPELYLN
ncbi:dTDP-4-dehydrorhamnose reductase [Paenibacillus algicola]|uniref:dTDP-4-dehydrorhamnose reductase n=1 Tax=Paenibacillus algicola TaxID=2565926 RepID=A0A4P8XRF5_9BACL|nr:dTDP-4-dehydrorhamnose reductase [Paenibacillus algicola]QCT04490.1 dTDP-4-dehydrorhamnose reductase [Paenibacillus algicola]